MGKRWDEASKGRTELQMREVRDLSALMSETAVWDGGEERVIEAFLRLKHVIAHYSYSQVAAAAELYFECEQEAK